MGTRYSHFSAEERGVIMAMKQHGHSGRAIARMLGRADSSVSRELARNGVRAPSTTPALGRPRRGYDAVRAGERAKRLRRRARRKRKLTADSALWLEVKRRLARYWSPRQISQGLREEYPDRPEWQVSHETIYTAIYAMPRGPIRREMTRLLKQHRAARRSPRQGPDRRGRMLDFQSIHLRPPEATERLVPGHWEGDFLVGARNRSAIGVLVDRKTLFTVLARMRGCTAADALEGFSRVLRRLPLSARQTLTYDQGKEMALHRVLTQHTNVSVYFADPGSPWQRGICENTNGLLRQYFPKGTDLSGYTQRQLDRIAHEFNTRPRASLGYQFPAVVFLHELGMPELAAKVRQSVFDSFAALRR
ncbi:IS30 family transposase [Lysobacter sp. CA196]|uniref:IS30 family transposase n=1 Tax=Lysobacter sp. CA196 TaxID=3455606 RepID=UPI003F8D1209